VVCSGSGTIIDEQGTVITNFHVIEQSRFCPHDQIGVAIAEASQSVPDLAYEADLLAVDEELDLAVVRIARDIDGAAINETFPAVEIGDSDEVSLGDEIRVLGYPGIGGDTITITTGAVSGFATSPEAGERSWLKTDATIAGGNSGGLAVDEEGRFIGIPTLAGSGSGEVVDCRIITDSNGDGSLSTDDSCVPIGGFINGVRPVALALPLIDDAATATPIDQGAPERDEPMAPLPVAFNPIWSSDIAEDDSVIDPITAGFEGMERVCITWEFEDLEAGSDLEFVWFIDGESISEADLTESNYSGPPDDFWWVCYFEDDGFLDAGTYEFAWLVDGEVVFGEGIVVGDGSTTTIDVVNTTDVPLCVVQFNPTDTFSYGLNELSEPLEPGETVIVELAVGAIDALIVDCNGDTRIEDATGFELTEPIILDVP
jgi:hypothetical protein